MNPDPEIAPNLWDERMSQSFIDYGDYFVPERQHQFQIMVDLAPKLEEPFCAVDLACGEGQFAKMLLDQCHTCTVYGLDGAPEMLQRARIRLAGYGQRFWAEEFNLAGFEWPGVPLPVQAVFSSLAIHHLDGLGKLALFQRVYQRLSPGGVFIVADIIAPAEKVGWELAARELDAAVRDNALRLDGNLAGFEAFKQQQWNNYRYPDEDDIDHPSQLFDQLKWLEQAGFSGIDVYWLRAGHAIFGGIKAE